MDELALTTDGPVATITIDRPAARNAITQEMWDELPRLAGRIVDADRARVVVIRSGTPGIFSAGADIREYRAHAGDVEWGIASQQRVSRAFAAIRRLPIPTVAVVDGACVGGGSGLAVACDLRIASERAFFAITPAKLGLVFSHHDTTLLVDLVGASAAKLLLFTGQSVDARRALAMGLVNAVHPVDDLDAGVAQVVGGISAVAPHSTRAMKQIIDLVEQGVREPTPHTEGLVEAALRSADHREGVSAFLERRPAVFTG